MLEALYQQYQFLTGQIETFNARLVEHLAPYAAQIHLLTTIPGVDRMVAWHLIAELGTDLTVFPTADHCASWAGRTPGEDESAGRQRSTRCKKGNKFLRRVLVQSAWAASRCKQGYLRALFYRIQARRGYSKAVVAVRHKILVIAYHILRTGIPFFDLGDDYFDRLNPTRTARRLVPRLERLGLRVELSLMEESQT